MDEKNSVISISIVDNEQKGCSHKHTQVQMKTHKRLKSCPKNKKNQTVQKQVQKQSAIFFLCRSLFQASKHTDSYKGNEDDEKVKM